VSASTSLPDTANCSPVSSNTTNTSPNVPTHHSPPDSNNLLQTGTRTVPDSPLSGLSQLACTGQSNNPQSPSTPGLLNSSSPNSNLNASPASHKNRFSPFRTGVGPAPAPANNNPSYKVQNIDPRQQQHQQQQQSYHPSTSYPNNTFQSPSVVSSHNFNGDIYNLQQQSLVSSSYRDQYHHHQQQQQQYSGQYHTQQYQPLVYSSTYDMSQPNYMSHNSFNDISAYTPMPQDGLNSIFPEHVNNRTTVKKERNSPEGSEGSDSLNEVGEHRCNECNKVFNRICYLKQHNKSFHQGEKPFKCTQCGKRFPAEVLYQEHLAKHAGDKPYKCEVCPKQFNHKTDLRRHMCLHTGEKPFTCDVCGKGFIREDRMVKHADTHKKKAAHVAGGLM